MKKKFVKQVEWKYKAALPTFVSIMIVAVCWFVILCFSIVKFWNILYAYEEYENAVIFFAIFSIVSTVFILYDVERKVWWEEKK